jgi:hypothetical protein
MDAQVSAIDAGCGKMAAAMDVNAALSAAFDPIDRRIKEFEGEDAAQSSPISPAAPSFPVADREEAPAVAGESASASEVAMEIEATLPSEDIIVTMQTDAAEAAIAHDDAVLDLIALEMAAPDFDEADIAGTDLIETNWVESAAQRAEPAVAREPEPTTQPSLGASLIANGIVRKPDTPVADPLAPIRRMSQAEKIAFFS